MYIYTYIFVEQSTLLNVILIFKKRYLQSQLFMILQWVGIFLCLNVFHLVQMKWSNFMETFLRARPGTLSHKSAIVDSLFLGLCLKKKNYFDVVMLLHQETSGPKLGPSNWSIHIKPFFILWLCLNTLVSC